MKRMMIVWIGVVSLLFLSACTQRGASSRPEQPVPLPTPPEQPAIATGPAADEQRTATGTAQQPLADVAAAMAEAAHYPRATAPRAPASPNFRPEGVGTAERTCVEVGPDADNDGLRSGEFVVGNFSFFTRYWHHDPANSKLWWQPLHTDTMPGLTVRATLLDDATITSTYHEHSIGESDYGRFYVSVIPLPRAGNWMLLATSGPDWGCFLVALHPKASS